MTGPSDYSHAMGDTVDLELYTYAESSQAYLVGETPSEPPGEHGHQRNGRWKLWLPKSQVESRGGADARGRRAYTVTRWWCEKNDVSD